MDDEIMGALISAAASVVVALVGKNGTPEHNDFRSYPPLTKSSMPWIATCAVLGVWIFVLPAMMNGPAGLNFLVIPVVVLVLARNCPIKPLLAASVTLGLFALNWIGGRSGSVVHVGRRSRPDHTYLLFILVVACVSAIVVYRVSLKRWNMGNTQAYTPIPPQPEQFTREVPVYHGGVAAELERLAQLYRAGNLSAEDFAQAKALVLHHQPVALRR